MYIVFSHVLVTISFPTRISFLGKIDSVFKMFYQILSTELRRITIHFSVFLQPLIHLPQNNGCQIAVWLSQCKSWGQHRTVRIQLFLQVNKVGMGLYSSTNVGYSFGEEKSKKPFGIGALLSSSGYSWWSTGGKDMFEKQLTNDEAIRIKNVVGLDIQYLARLLVLILKISAIFEAMLNLYPQARKAGLHYDDYIFLRKFEQSNPNCLTITSETDWWPVSTSIRDEDNESIYDDDHIAIPIWPYLEKIRNVEEVPTEHTQDSDNFETWIKHVNKESKNKKRIWDEKKAPHPFLL